MNDGQKLRKAISDRGIVPFIGVYDVFSASLAAKHYDALFLSGFGFAASYYGLPDIGFIAWPDIVSYVERIRTVLPEHHLLVDIDDGYCDTEVASHVVSLLERAGASAVVLEDQKRPRKCGHFEGKELMELEGFQNKLERVLRTRRDMMVVARTDASDVDEIIRRVQAFAEVGPDVILVDAVRDLNLVGRLHLQLGKPFAFNQIAGGKSPPCDLKQLQSVGVGLVIYSTPCLFAAQTAIDDAMRALKSRNGRLPDEGVGVAECTAVLSDNLARRDAVPFNDNAAAPVPIRHIAQDQALERHQRANSPVTPDVSN